MLKETFIALISSYAPEAAPKLWQEIEQCYSAPGRHYHTLTHLENLFAELTGIKPVIQDWNTILFTLYYHDVVYNTLKHNNEEKSAELARKRMLSVSVPKEMIEKCASQILATKQHLECTDSDTNFFTDADLSILGSDPETYALYAINVRKEYSIYPDIIYNPGRRKVLQHFLQMDHIFKTPHFRDKFEVQARGNLKGEMELY